MEFAPELSEPILWAQFAAAALHRPDISIPEAASYADALLKEFTARYTWDDDLGWFPRKINE